jgi:hypothetical protein
MAIDSDGLTGINYQAILNGSNYPESPDTSIGVKSANGLPKLRQNFEGGKENGMDRNKMDKRGKCKRFSC